MPLACEDAALINAKTLNNNKRNVVCSLKKAWNTIKNCYLLHYSQNDEVAPCSVYCVWIRTTETRDGNGGGNSRTKTTFNEYYRKGQMEVVREC